MPRSRSRGRVRKHGRKHGHVRSRPAIRIRAIPVVPMPTSTPDCIVIPYDKVNKKFSTAEYSSSQTQDRASLQEIEQFLEQVNVPIKDWYENHANYLDMSGGVGIVFCICVILFPLLVFYICWYNYAQDRALKKYKEAVAQATLWISSNQQQFIGRDLMWNVPKHFPQWIELWTRVGGPPPQPTYPGLQVQPDALLFGTPQQQQPGFGGEQQGFGVQQQQGFGSFQQPGIQMTSMPQQNYQNGGMTQQQDYQQGYNMGMQQNQYSANMYSGNAQSSFAQP